MIERPASRLRPRVKICCIASTDEAEMAIRHGVDAIGLVSQMPSGPGVISDDLIEEIAACVPRGISVFLLTSSREVDAIIAQQRRFQVDTIQLCDALPPQAMLELRSALPGVSIVQSIHVLGEEAVDEARMAARSAHALLLDSGNPGRPVRELGGTGRTHDWALSRRIRDEVDVPVYLAGGLSPDNVADAASRVRPYGVDVCTGLRRGGRLEEGLLERFIHNLESASPRQAERLSGGSRA